MMRIVRRKPQQHSDHFMPLIASRIWRADAISIANAAGETIMATQGTAADIEIDGPLTASEKKAVAEHAAGLVAKRERVVALFNAISNLHEGDLFEVLDLDRYGPMDEDDELHPRLHLARSGKELGGIFEVHLQSLYGFGEGVLPMESKESHGKTEFGAWRFLDPEDYDEEDKSMH
jgi:hypothetical protein